MAHNNTPLAQVLKCVPRHEFEKLAKEHHRGQAFRSASRWSQFTALVMAQLSGRGSLRDITAILSAQAHRFYHLDSTQLTRSTRVHLNAEKPYTHVCSKNYYTVVTGWHRDTISVSKPAVCLGRTDH